MIKYNLKCCDCSRNFDSWFSSSNEFERIKKIKMLACYNCNSNNIEKSLMAPNILNSKQDLKVEKKTKFSEIKNKIKDYQKFIKNNFDFVGSNFSYEARSIHYNKNEKSKNKKKGIYGNATSKEIKELSEEGIETHTFPWINDKEN